jgi:hypothetical protein
VNETSLQSLHFFSWLMVLLGVASCVFVAVDIGRRKPQPMAVMSFVWPINALWAGILGVWAYWKIGRTGPPGGTQHSSCKHE